MNATPPRIKHGTMLPAGILAAALFALLTFAPLASSASYPVAGGSTTIALNHSFVKKLKRSDIVVQRLSPAKLRGNRATFTVSRGSVDPTTGLGTVNFSGGIQFKAGKKKAPVKSLVLDTAKRTLTGIVAGKKLKLATISAATSARNGFGVNIAIKSMRLTGQAARQLNKKLGLNSKRGRAATSKVAESPFKADQLLGSARAETQPQKVAILPAGEAMLALNLPVFTTLKEVNVELEPIAPSNLVAAGPPPLFASPIAGESVAPNATAGIVKTTGGLTLVQSFGSEGGQTTMTLGAFWIDLGTTTVTVEMKVASHGLGEGLNLGSLGRRAFADISLTGATVSADPATRTVTVQNATATLGTATADRLNQLFVEPFERKREAPAKHFAAGDQFGTFSFTVQTQ